MNDENQGNKVLKGPVIFTIPASLTVPGFGFLIALNPDWGFEGINKGDDSSRAPCRQAGRSFQESLTVLGRGSVYHPWKT
jgi:hypothetical protein